MKTIIGRETEKKILREVIESDNAELVVIYGRRRVGKTFLIREFFEKELVFEFSGQYDAKTKIQLQNFSNKLDQSTKSLYPSSVPNNWTEALNRLKTYLNPILDKKKAVVFFDEFPWIDSPKSDFLSSFDYFWNDWASKKDNLKVIICGSAASWMIRKVIQNKGGLHNRITKKIRLLPFTLKETENYLQNKNITLDRFQILQLYMAFGGVPHYLKEVKKGQSTSQTIDNVCFTKEGLLFDEFNSLFRSLFKNHEIHVQIIRELSKKNSGLTRNELLQKMSIKSGGTASLVMEELEESGFVTGYIPFGKNKKDSVYKLTDEYCLFYLKFIENNKGKQSWVFMQNAQSWKSWAGFSFESICQKHIREIKKALGISGIYTEESSWRFRGDEKEEGSQIDLLIDRKDGCINICEMKFSEFEFVIDKKYAADIAHKISTFKEVTKTKKTVFFTAVSTHGFKNNEYKLRWVQSEITMNDLFV
ncbi:MAG: AAA family ATPase [Emticicia sp.]|uniref:AAA family ATPase n=1 Tax=Emticicia sp. TaxID=1930953 RepID=UPI003BA5EF16